MVDSFAGTVDLSWGKVKIVRSQVVVVAYLEC